MGQPRSVREIGVAVVFLQPQCNMTCTFCVTEDEFDAMSFDQALELLDHLEENGVRTVTFGGGEPCAWPGDVIALAREAKRRRMTVQIGTNGVALPGNFATLDCVDRWVLPLESADPAVHDAMRRRRGGHHRVILRCLDALRYSGRSVTVSTVITSVNRAGLLELAGFLRDYARVSGNLHAWHLYQFLPLGRGGESNRAELEIPAADYRELCDAVNALALPFRVYRRFDMYRSLTVEFFWCKDGRIVSGSDALHRDGAARTSGRVDVPQPDQASTRMRGR